MGLFMVVSYSWTFCGGSLCVSVFLPPKWANLPSNHSIVYQDLNNKRSDLNICETQIIFQVFSGSNSSYNIPGFVRQSLVIHYCQTPDLGQSTRSWLYFGYGSLLLRSSTIKQEPSPNFFWLKMEVNPTLHRGSGRNVFPYQRNCLFVCIFSKFIVKLQTYA